MKKINKKVEKMVDLIISFFPQESLKQLEVDIKGKKISFKEQLLSYYENMHPSMLLSSAEIRIGFTLDGDFIKQQLTPQKINECIKQFNFLFQGTKSLGKVAAKLNSFTNRWSILGTWIISLSALIISICVAIFK